MFHLQAYTAALGVAASNSPLAAVNDTIFTPRNNQFIYTEQWYIAWLFTLAANQTAMRSNLPKWNAIGRHHIFPVNRSLTIPTPYNLQDLRQDPLPLSLNEGLTWEGSNNLGAATEATRVFQAIVPPGWDMRLPPALARINVRFTGAVAGVADAWSGPGAIVFPDQDLRGGVYSIVGAHVFDAGTQAFRFILPRQPLSQGRLLRPGGICLEALQNLPHPIFQGGMGEWGRFHTFEPPQIEIFANATAASIQEGRMDLLYLGEDVSLLDQQY